MKSKFFAVASILMLIFSACQKELSFDSGGNPGGGSGGGTARFSFGGSPADCTGALLAGTYTAGVPTSSANTLTLQVIVDSIGTWQVNSNLVNGVSFSGSGTFTVTGSQNILLTASGTPVLPGTFTLSPGSAACTFSLTVAPGNVTTAFDYFFDVTINGEKTEKHATDIDTTYLVHYGYEYYVGDSNIIFESGIIPYEDPNPLNSPFLTIRKGIFAAYDTASNDRKKAFFAPGNYPYASVSDLNGIEIIWVDKDNKTWSSRNAPADQVGSIFTITTLEEFTGPFGDYTLKFTATFNCKLYDDMGNAVTLTNGRYFNEIIP